MLENEENGVCHHPEAMNIGQRRKTELELK